MSSDLHIRRYEPSDEERVWAVHEEALRASSLEFIEDAPRDTDIREISDRYLGGSGDFLVGLVNNEIVAIGGFQLRDDRTAELRRMRVHPDYQNEGVGSRILEALEERARDCGVERLVLDTNEQLRAARYLYRKHGYKETHREPHPVTGDELIYYKKEL